MIIKLDRSITDSLQKTGGKPVYLHCTASRRKTSYTGISVKPRSHTNLAATSNVIGHLIHTSTLNMYTQVIPLQYNPQGDKF